jgi:hypothetical protein
VAVSIFQFWSDLAHAIGRFFRGETSHAGQGAITCFESGVHVVRAPVRGLSERQGAEFDLAYEEITRAELAR